MKNAEGIEVISMTTINLIFPNQLFKHTDLVENTFSVVLLEEDLFFTQYPFHKQKLLYHRASMKAYAQYLEKRGKEVMYVDAISPMSSLDSLFSELKAKGVEKVLTYDPVDNYLQKRLKKASGLTGIELDCFDNPLFLNNRESLDEFFKEGKKRYFHNDFYIQQRKRMEILLDPSGGPLGGKWSYDADNRKKYPRKKEAPQITWPKANDFFEEAYDYVEANFSNNYGHLNKDLVYPYTFDMASTWLDQFLEERFDEFGVYEDAMVEDEGILNHSVLTPMMNVGLISPKEVIDRAISYAAENEIPLNSLEGFIRQIIGWREFIRGYYELLGTESRTRNYWGFKRKIPKSFYTGDTGIAPLDKVIKRLLDTSYNHHIERLMVLGNFMLLCEFDPDEVYRWFMEMYIDAYDWVMVPNVYGMSQFSDGGLMATKPYISGSNYLMKMSNFKKGEWQKTWDGLFWRFMHVHRSFFTKNPRLGMLVKMFDKMAEEKKEAHLEAAERYLTSLDN